MKKVFAILLSVLLVCALAVSAFAAFESSKCVLTTAKTELKRGETFTVTAVLTNSETVNLGTVALTYDADVFELVGGQCLVSGTMLGTVTVPNKAGTFMLNGSSALSGDLFTFELKVKENAPVGAVKLDQKTSIGMGNGTYITAEGLNLNIYCEHVFDQEVVDDKYVATAATCTTLGTYYKSCTCGAKGTETFVGGELAAHNYNQEVVAADYLATEATCQAKATYYKTCTCGAKGTATFAAGTLAAHTEVTDKAVPSTCTTEGKSEGKHCSVCGTVTVAQTPVAKLPHTEVTDAAVPATCTAEGKTEGKHCSVCGTVTVAQTPVAKLPHTEVVDAAVAPTCTEAGKTEGKHCSVCDTVIVAQETVDALGHTFDKEVIADDNKAADATCTSGTTYYLHCSVCDAKGTETFAVGEPIAHTFDQEVVDAKFLATEATCQAKATYYKSCTCGAKGTETFEAGELAEHKYDEGKVTVEPTPEKDGEKVCTCTVCGAQKTEAVPYLETPATGDNTVLVPMILLAVLSLCGMAVVVVMKKRAA